MRVIFPSAASRRADLNGRGQCARWETQCLKLGQSCRFCSGYYGSDLRPFADRSTNGLWLQLNARSRSPTVARLRFPRHRHDTELASRGEIVGTAALFAIPVVDEAQNDDFLEAVGGLGSR